MAKQESAIAAPAIEFGAFDWMALAFYAAGAAWAFAPYAFGAAWLMGAF